MRWPWARKPMRISTAPRWTGIFCSRAARRASGNLTCTRNWKSRLALKPSCLQLISSLKQTGAIRTPQREHLKRISRTTVFKRVKFTEVGEYYEIGLMSVRTPTGFDSKRWKSDRTRLLKRREDTGDNQELFDLTFWSLSRFLRPQPRSFEVSLKLRKFWISIYDKCLWRWESPDLGRANLIGIIRKTRNVFKKLRFCGKRKNCTQQLTSILKRLTLTRLQAFTSQIVNFKSF